MASKIRGGFLSFFLPLCLCLSLSVDFIICNYDSSNLTNRLENIGELQVEYDSRPGEVLRIWLYQVFLTEKETTSFRTSDEMDPVQWV